MARGEDTWGGRPDTGRNWPPAERPRTREEARADLDRRTDERDIDRRHDWRGAGGRTGGGREAWPPADRPRNREEARADLDRRTDERDIDRRHDWRGGGGGGRTGAGREAWPPATRPRTREEARADLDRRTDERDIDRRHDWHGPGAAARGRQARMGPARMERPRTREELREDLDRRTDADEINRRHAWGGGERGYRPEETRRPEEDRELPRRGFAGPDWVEGPGLGAGRAVEGRGPEPRRGEGRGGEGRGEEGRRAEGRGGEGRGYEGRGEGARNAPGRGDEERFDERPYLADEGPEDTGYGGAGEGWDDRGLPYSGGYGGYGGGEYGGSYGGIGPGKTGTYPASYTTGLSGGGSILGQAGDVSGWEETREMGPRSTASMLERASRRGWAREGPLVRDVMTRNPRTVGPDDNVVQAARAMREEDAGIIPVAVDGRVIGVVTDRDLAMRVLAEGKGTDAKVSEVMSEDVHVCTADDRLVDAVRVMGEENVRRLPVVDRDDRLLGVISMTDVAREAELDYALQEALEQLAGRRSFWSRW